MPPRFTHQGPPERVAAPDAVRDHAPDEPPDSSSSEGEEET